MLILFAKKGMNYTLFYFCIIVVITGVLAVRRGQIVATSLVMAIAEGWWRTISKIEVKHCKIETIAGGNYSTQSYLLDSKGGELYPLS